MAIGRQNPEDELRKSDTTDYTKLGESDSSQIVGAGVEDEDVNKRLDEVTK